MIRQDGSCQRPVGALCSSLERWSYLRNLHMDLRVHGSKVGQDSHSTVALRIERVHVFQQLSHCSNQDKQEQPSSRSSELAPGNSLASHGYLFQERQLFAGVQIVEEQAVLGAGAVELSTRCP